MKNLIKILTPIIILVLLSFCGKENPKVIINTQLGNIEIELYADKAPKTVGNFLKYVDGGHYKNSEFYRTVTLNNQPGNDVKIEVIQGGLWDDKDIFPPVEHETTKQTGIKHLDGVISMARLGPGTAQDDFFICVGDQPSLDFEGDRNPDKQGFAAFGKVIKGMDIVKQIQLKPAEKQYLNPRVIINNIERVTE